jgi:hypothetical protein
MFHAGHYSVAFALSQAINPICGIKWHDMNGVTCFVIVYRYAPDRLSIGAGDTGTETAFA